MSLSKSLSKAGFDKLPQWQKALLAVASGAAVLAAAKLLYSLCKKKTINILVFSGPSGVGKGTLINKLLQDYPDHFALSVSHTTRAPRQGEKEGKNYHFVTREKIEEMIKNDEFFEYSEVHNNIYGTSLCELQEVTRGDRVAILEIDVKGAQKLKARQKKWYNVCFIFIRAPDQRALAQRILGRGGETRDMEVRLATAKEEEAFITQNPDFYHKVVVNDDLERAYVELQNVLKKHGSLPAGAEIKVSESLQA